MGGAFSFRPAKAASVAFRSAKVAFFLASPSLTEQLGTLFEGGSAAGLSDGQLIERFVSCNGQIGEAAFAALLARHGPMVLGVCRQLMGDRQRAEDAFQAVFLVLARKAIPQPGRRSASRLITRPVADFQDPPRPWRRTSSER